MNTRLIASCKGLLLAPAILLSGVMNAAPLASPSESGPAIVSGFPAETGPVESLEGAEGHGLTWILLVPGEPGSGSGPDSEPGRGASDSLEQAVRTNDLFRFADATLYAWSGPIRWEGKDWAVLGGTLAGTALSALADEPIKEFWTRRDAPVWDAVERAGYHWGKPYAAFALTGGFYLTGVIFKNEWARETGLILGSAFLSSTAIQTALKTAVGRARPGTGLGNWVFDPMSPEADYHSFPSGHIQVALATALVLARRVESPALKILFYAAGGTTLVSRLYSGAHWVSDLVFGGAISWFCTESVIRRIEAGRGQAPFKRLKAVNWNVGPSPYGISITGSFR